MTLLLEIHLQLSLPGEIETRIQAVLLDVETRLQNGEKAVFDDRDYWSKVNKHYPFV